MKKSVPCISALCLLITVTSFLFLGCPSELSENEQEEETIANTPDNLLFINDSSLKGSGPEVLMWFTPPTELGASSYTLQYSTDDKATWDNFQWYGDDLVTGTTAASNFSIDINTDCYLRLFMTGGQYDGQTSNETYCTRCTIGGYLSNWSLDESMWHTGIMTPNVGFGLVAEFLVKDPSTVTEIEDCLTYQWYRLDPEDYENMILIPGATSLSYTTTIEDKGYYMVIKATGDGSKFNGFAQQKSMDIVQ
jgi:hypothetical protein